MAELTVIKDTLGAEDLAFGTGTKTRTIQPGVTTTVSQVNASHIPLVDTAAQFTTDFVEDALVELKADHDDQETRLAAVETAPSFSVGTSAPTDLTIPWLDTSDIDNPVWKFYHTTNLAWEEVTARQNGRYEQAVLTGDWTLDTPNYYIDITHNLGETDVLGYLQPDGATAPSPLWFDKSDTVNNTTLKTRVYLGANTAGTVILIGGAVSASVSGIADLSDVSADEANAFNDSGALRAAAADATNPFACLDDIHANTNDPTTDQKAALDGANSPAAGNVLATMNDIPSAAAVPQGVIVLWSGSLATIPAGFGLCDGTLSTPNLQDKFVVGAGLNYTVGATGGQANMPQHSHGAGTLTVSGTTDAGGAHTHSQRVFSGGGSYAAVTTAGNESSAAFSKSNISTSSNHTHGITGASISGSIANEGTGTTPDDNRPPYYALAYIQKL